MLFPNKEKVDNVEEFINRLNEKLNLIIVQNELNNKSLKALLVDKDRDQELYNRLVSEVIEINHLVINEFNRLFVPIKLGE